VAITVFAGSGGIVTVGAIYLVVQAVLALVLLPTLVGRLRTGDIRMPELAAVTSTAEVAAADPAGALGLPQPMPGPPAPAAGSTTSKEHDL
jgi:hypothetical protein